MPVEPGQPLFTLNSPFCLLQESQRCSNWWCSRRSNPNCCDPDSHHFSNKWNRLSFGQKYTYKQKTRHRLHCICFQNIILTFLAVVKWKTATRPNALALALKSSLKCPDLKFGFRMQAKYLPARASYVLQTWKCYIFFTTSFQQETESSTSSNIHLFLSLNLWWPLERTQLFFELFLLYLLMKSCKVCVTTVSLCTLLM